MILLARLAVDVSIHGKGVGSALRKDALLRTAQAAETIGARALLVHAKDDEARAFYEHFTFEASPSDPYNGIADNRPGHLGISWTPELYDSAP